MRSPADELAERSAAALHRQLRTLSAASGASLTLANGDVLQNFGSNDYLGLASHPALKKAAINAATRYGTGSRSSRLVTGSLDIYQRLESRLARLKRTDAALTFSTGYAAAVGTLTALLRKGDTVILDKLCHASLIDGARLSGAKIRVFPHNSLTKLRKILEQTPTTWHTRTIIVTESVFSMDGDFAPLREIVDLKDEFGAWLLVDEAHAFGLFGDHGSGRAEQLGLHHAIELQMGTFSKAAGSAGGYLAASGEIIELLVNSARSFIYSTAPPPAQAAASLTAIDLIDSAEGRARRETLSTHIAAIAPKTSDACHIIPYPIGDAERAVAVSAQLMERGFFVPAIRYPTVPRDSARLRISLTADHSSHDIEQLRNALESVGA